MSDLQRYTWNVNLIKNMEDTVVLSKKCVSNLNLIRQRFKGTIVNRALPSLLDPFEIGLNRDMIGHKNKPLYIYRLKIDG